MALLINNNNDNNNNRRRLRAIWLERHPDLSMSEGKLAGQVYALRHCSEFSDLEIERFKRELGLATETSQTVELLLASLSESTPISVPAGSSHDEHQYSEPLATSLGSEDTRDSDPMRKTILHYMTINFQDRTTLPKLNSVNVKELNKLLRKVNEVISGISTSTLEETNRLVYGTAKLVCEAIGPKGFGCAAQSTPPWKIRLNKKLLTL